MADYAYGLRETEFMEGSPQYDFIQKRNAKAASDDLTRGLDAQVREHKAKAVKQKMEDDAFGEQQRKSIEKGRQYDIDRQLDEKAASDELARGLDAQIRDHNAEALKHKMEDYAYGVQQRGYIEKGVQYDIAQKLHEKAASDDLTRGLDAQVRDHKAKAAMEKMEDYAYGAQQQKYIEKGLQYDIAQKLDEKAASDELASGLDAQVRDHKAEAVKQKIEDDAFYGDKQHKYVERGVQYDIAQKLNEKAALDELSNGLDAQIRDHKAEAVKQKMEDYAYYSDKQHKYLEKGVQYDIAQKLHEKTASEELASGLDAQLRDHKAEALKHKMEDYAYGEQQHKYLEKGVQYDIAQKLHEKAASDELASGLDAQLRDHKAEALKQKMEDYAYGEQQHKYLEKGVQYDIAQKLHDKAASEELTSGLDAQVRDHKTEALKHKMEDYAYGEQQHKYLEKGVQYDIAQKLHEKAASEELTSGLDAQVRDHNTEALKHKMEDYAYGEQQHEYMEKGLQYDIEQKLHEKAASDELTSGLDAQVRDHEAKAVKQKMEDYAYCEMQSEYREMDLQYDIAQKLDEKAASDELTSGLDAQVRDHKAEAVKQKMEDYADREKMMEEIEEAMLQEEDEKNVIKAKNKIYGADLLQQIDDDKKRHEKEGKLHGVHGVYYTRF